MKDQQTKLNVEQIFIDYGIEYEKSNNGWINCHCPDCYKGDGKKGLGIHEETNATNCFRCGKLSLKSCILKLLRKNVVEWSAIVSKYKTYNLCPSKYLNAVESDLDSFSSVLMPYGTDNMSKKHKNYLKSRNFDPKQLEREWGLKGTGLLGKFKHRIIIPIIQNGKLVNFTSRDITGKANERYKTCPNEKSLTPLKECIYGIDDVNETAFIAEGPFDVWRLGKGNAVATFGTVVTNAQLLLLKKIKRRFILFDNDEAGKEAADKLGNLLSFFEGETNTINLEGDKDCAELKEEEKNYLLKLLK